MKSNVCKIDNGTRDLAAILKESEKVAVYNELTQKQTLQLRLLCEEIDGLLPNIIDDFEGDFWIDYADGVCKVNISIRITEINAAKKGELLGISKNKKNAAAVGIAGKIRNAIENVVLNPEMRGDGSLPATTFYLTNGYNESIDYSYLWSLGQYKTTVNKEVQTEEWDELEKSIIANVADDVVVGIKGKRADILIVKKFD